MKVQEIRRREWSSGQPSALGVHGKNERRKERKREEKSIPYLMSLESKINSVFSDLEIMAIIEIRLDTNSRISFSFRMKDENNSLIQSPSKEWVEIVNDVLRSYDFNAESGFSIDKAV